MPVPKRYFKMSHEINHDPEVWELTTLFGDRSLRLWMQFLASFDKSDNQFKLSGLWVSQLAKVTKLNLQTVVKATFWMIDRGWITIVGEQKLAEEWSEIGRRLTGDWPKNHRRLTGDLPETHRRMIEEWSEIGRRLSLCAANHAKYNRTQEQKRITYVPLLTNPTPTPNQSDPNQYKKEEKSTAVVTNGSMPKRLVNRGSVFPEGFAFNERSEEMAKGYGLNVHKEFAAFRDYHVAKGTIFRNWEAGFRTWLRNAVKFSAKGSR